MTDVEINIALGPLVADRPVAVLMQMAHALREQQMRDVEAGTLPDISGGIVTNWTGIKTWLLDGADGSRDLHALTVDAKNKLAADQKVAFIASLLLIFKAALRNFPDIKLNL